MLIVQVCDFGEDGDALYRAHAPNRALGALPGVTSIDCHFLSRHLPELSRRADVLLTHFVNDWDFLELCLQRKAAGKVTVFEANDYYLDLQPWNPNARNWADGTLVELLRCFLKLADGVQTSTDWLARRWKVMGADEVAVFPNQLTEVPDLPPLPERPLTIGWGGSAGHLADWYHVAPMLQRWLEVNAEVRLAVMGAEAARSFFNLPGDRYTFLPNGGMEQYLRFLRGIDIGLAPLLPTQFNRGRSDAKFLEYASQGVAGIYSELEPYRACVVPGETGLFFGSAEQLVEQIERLRTDTALRSSIRAKAYEYVRRRRRLGDHIPARLAWYRSLVSRSATKGDTFVASDPHAPTSGGYSQVRPEEPEHALRVALHAPTAAEAVARLDPVVAAYPGYHVALVHYGVLLNSLKRYGDAAASLSRVAEIEPGRARAHAEIGRSRFHLNDPSGARQAMEQAVRSNPWHLPAWQYLLRLLVATRSSDAAEWSGRAVEIFPHSRSIALLAVATLPPGLQVVRLTNLLDRFVPDPDDLQRTAALGEFRRAIRAAITVAPLGPPVVELLRRASELFPESTTLAGDYGSALFRAGRVEEALAEHARALHLHRAAGVDHDELGADHPAPVLWQLAEHIRRVRNGAPQAQKTI